MVHNRLRKKQDEEEDRKKMKEGKMCNGKISLKHFYLNQSVIVI